MRLLALAVLLARPVAAEEVPWAGIWAAEQDMACTEVRTYDGQMLATETTACAITGRAVLPGLGAWALTLNCLHEGEIYPAERLILFDAASDVIWEWYGSGVADPLRLRRCAG